MQSAEEFLVPVMLDAQKFRKSCQEIKWVSCPECRINFPDVKLSSGICTTCSLEKQRAKIPRMFSAANCMDPGIVPIELSRLSNLEQILVARIHPVMSVYRVKGQQHKYSGNVINFEQDVNLIATILPIKLADSSTILIVQRNGKHASKEFRVRREFSTPGYISMAFPALFPYGNEDLRQARPRQINHSEYFQYLMKFHDGRFAKDSRFRYFAWNS
ncbi:hypothetical protein FRX31_033888 [Thalictrum thalictroides]|uniref:DUF6570 domain-containing protein n=1 Tax=Thalictrum thalictroides TaxID=46969 RepID=A0A7J6UWG0_THATH|nr:hypothetical protein FRX31_033888 [Thalictrum thalictroides]